MRKRFFLAMMVLSAVFLSHGCGQKVEVPKYKVSVTQPANGSIQVSPALPAGGMVKSGSSLTFTLSANKGFKVKTLTICGITYSDVTDNRITKKVKIEKDTSVSAVLEAEAKPEDPAPSPETKHTVTVTQPANGKIEVTPALPADSMVTNGSELTFTLSANKGYKVKTLTIGGTAYSDVTDKRITKKVKIEKNTEVSAVLEAETKPEDPNNPKPEEPAPDKTDVPNTTTEIKDDKESQEDKDAIGEHRGTIKVVKITQNGKSEEQVEITGNILSKKAEDVLKLLKDEKYKDKKISKDSNLNIKFTQNSSTIDKSKLNELAQLMPNPIKIDDEKTVKLDKNANITSITGSIKLSDLTKGEATKNEVNFAEFISDKIAAADQKIESEYLEINSEDETFSKENLEKLANTLSKTSITNTTLNGTQNITLGENAAISSISGNITLKDIAEAKDEASAKLAKYIAYKLKTNIDKDFPSHNLKINTFYKKTPTIQGISLDVLETLNFNVEYEHFTITPDSLKILQDMENNALNKATLNFKDGDKTIPVSFKSYDGNTDKEKQKDYFDITDFSKNITTGKLKNINETSVDGNIFLRGERNKESDGYWDTTPYPKVDELLTIIKNIKQKDKITVGSVQLRGNVKELLQHLIGSDKITEIGDGIQFTSFTNSSCPIEYLTYYNGNGEEITEEEIKALHTRTTNRKVYIKDAIIKNLITKEKTFDQLKDLNFRGDLLSNVSVIESDLSNLSFGVQTESNTYLKFEKTILPKDMSNSHIKNLILKNVSFPKKEIMEYIKNSQNQVDIIKLSSLFPSIEYELEIYGYIKNSPLDDLTTKQLQELETIVLYDDDAKNMPKSYKGPMDIYNKLKKYIYSGESKFINGEKNTNYTGNTTGSLNKPLHKQQDQLLAILKKRKERSHG